MHKSGYKRPLRIADTGRPLLSAATCAHDVMKAAASLGISVPGELSVIGHDNSELSTITTPPMSTISLPFEEIGRAAANLLLESIHDRSSLCKHLPRSPQYIRRGTVDKAPSYL